LLNGALHGAAIGNTAFELVSNVLGDQHRIGIGRGNLFDIQFDLLADQCFKCLRIFFTPSPLRPIKMPGLAV
jgi:hypothetical protein